jgi:hypothetical protein
MGGWSEHSLPVSHKPKPQFLRGPSPPTLPAQSQKAAEKSGKKLEGWVEALVVVVAVALVSVQLVANGARNNMRGNRVIEVRRSCQLIGIFRIVHSVLFCGY